MEKRILKINDRITLYGGHLRTVTDITDTHVYLDGKEYDIEHIENMKYSWWFNLPTYDDYLYIKADLVENIYLSNLTHNEICATKDQEFINKNILIINNVIPEDVKSFLFDTYRLHAFKSDILLSDLSTILHIGKSLGLIKSIRATVNCTKE